MSVQNRIIEAIQESQKLDLFDNWSLTQLQQFTFRLENGADSCFIKWISDEDTYGQNEIRVNQELLNQANIPAPRLRFVLKTTGASIAGWDWLDGNDLRYQSREILAEAFTRLAHFHATQRYSETVYSPTSYQAYPSIHELLNAELDLLCANGNNDLYPQCFPLFKLIEEAGYPTIIHGDKHPGNMWLTPNGLQFVDWGYAIRSINLFDLDYIQSIAIDTGEGENWWDITPAEAKLVLPAYCNASGLLGLDYLPTHRAVMVWSELRNYYNVVRKGNQDAALRIRRKIEQLLA